MPVLAKFYGIVIRKLIGRSFGIHLHAFYGDTEMIVALNPVRIVQSEAPSWVEELVINWVHQHEKEVATA
jgi:hypothetical protein